MEKDGIVYLIGAGPGDPGLFTLKGKKILETADVVVYDRLVSSKILSWARPDAELIYVGKVAGKHALSQDEINALLVEKAKNGKNVARLKGGDPFLFGRGGEEALYIRDNGLDFEEVPGITSAIAVPAYAGIPVTHRETTSSFAVITGHEKPGKNESSIKWREISEGIGTLVFLMGMENLPYICANLIQNGRGANSPIALIRWGTWPGQEVLVGTLENIVAKVRDSDFKPPAVIVVGEVVNLREQLKWIEKKALWGKKIVVTRARAQASMLVDKIIDLGGEAIEFPAIEIKKETNLHALNNALHHIDKYDWIIFTSVNGVDIFFEEMSAMEIDIRGLKDIELCAIGPATGERLAARGLRVRSIPDEYSAEGIISELKGRIRPGQWILLPRARGAREVLPDTLREWGACVNEVYLYQTAASTRVSQDVVNWIKNGDFDYLTFASSSTVSNFVKLIGREYIDGFNQKIKVVCIGPVTAATARQHGFKVDIVAGQYTIAALIEALVSDCRMLNGGTI